MAGWLLLRGGEAEISLAVRGKVAWGPGVQFASGQALLFFFLVFLPFLGPPPWHMEVPRLGVESEP